MDYSIPIDEVNSILKLWKRQQLENMLFVQEFKMEFCFEGKDAGRGDGEQQRWYQKNFLFLWNQDLD